MDEARTAGKDEAATALHVDWECGQGSMTLGRRFDDAPARFRYDVLADWKAQIERLFLAAEADLHPEQQRRRSDERERFNQRRRLLCEQLAGQRIAVAEPLVNGDVLLHLDGGKALVLFARDEDVKLDIVADTGHARRRAAADGTGDYYLREPR